MQLLSTRGAKLTGAATLATLAGLVACHSAEASQVLGSLQQAAFIPGACLVLVVVVVLLLSVTCGGGHNTGRGTN